MSRDKIVQVGNRIIRQRCAMLQYKEILHPSTKKLIHKLHETVLRAGGVGLAAPQIGESKQIFIIHIAPTKFRPAIENSITYNVINPTILSYSKDLMSDYEGCFSVADANLFAKVERPKSIKVEYLDENAIKHTRNLNGLEARVFMHEYDHLQGIIFLDQKMDTATLMGGYEYKKMKSLAN